MSFTSGPWKKIDAIDKRQDRYIRGFDGKAVCRIVYTGRAYTEWHANANLIAAAPDMKSLLEDLQEYLCEHGGEAVELLGRVDAILAKARGEV